MSTTIGQWLEAATATLAAASDQARADAEELLSRLLRRSRTELYLERETPVSTEQARTLERWLERRAAGEPVQYITGRAAFRGLDLAVTSAVLIPRPETERLVEAVLEVLAEQRARWPAPRVLDLGTGSGAIALALAEEWPAARVSASERSEQALEVARTNAGERGLEARVRFLAGDWLDAVPGDERFEVIVSNPPYIAETERDALPIDVREHEPAAALFSGPTGLEALREIVDQSPRHLVAGGLLALELAEMRALEVRAWLDGARDWEEVALRDDLTGRPRILLARRQAGPAIAPAQWGEEG
jgi:release factor glutamine methyltransferase